MAFEDGIKFYTSAVLNILVHFPENKVTCQWCQFVKNEDSLKRHKCTITGELLLYPFTHRGNECPLIFDIKEEWHG